MPASELEGWVCPDCGRTNYYCVSNCVHCGVDRAEADVSSSNANEGDFRSPDYYQAPVETGSSPLKRNKRFIFLALACLSFFIWFTLMWEYRKWNASWGSINVLLVTALAAVIMGWWIAGRTWFRDCSSPTGWRYMAIPTAGFIICAAGGIFFTEPIRSPGASIRPAASSNTNYQYSYNNSRIGGIYLFTSIFDLSGAAADADDECLPFVLVLVVLLLVVASFIVPHFWVLATFLMIVLLTMFTFREWWLVSPIEQL